MRIVGLALEYGEVVIVELVFDMYCQPLSIFTGPSLSTYLYSKNNNWLLCTYDAINCSGSTSTWKKINEVAAYYRVNS